MRSIDAPQNKQGQISAELQELFAAQEAVSKSVGELEKALLPVLLSPQIETRNDAKPDKELVPLAHELRKSRTALLSLTNKLDKMRQRVEL